MIGLCALEVTVSFPSTDAGLAALLFINMYHGFTSPKVMIDRYTRHINGVASRFSEATNKLQQGFCVLTFILTSNTTDSLTDNRFRMLETEED